MDTEEYIRKVTGDPTAVIREFEKLQYSAFAVPCDNVPTGEYWINVTQSIRTVYIYVSPNSEFYESLSPGNSLRYHTAKARKEGKAYLQDLVARVRQWY